MFNKITQTPLLSFLLILQFLSDDVTSNIEPFPMSQFPTGSSGISGGGISDVTGSSISINSGSGSSSSSSSSGGESGSTNGFVWSPRQVVTKLGTVQGFIARPPNGYEGVEVFLNMPYASPPEGSLRFMPPVSGSPWQGTRRSETPSPVCPQVLPNIRNESEALKVMPRGRLIYLRRLLPHLRNQSEDCLYLNLYVPVGVAEGRIQGKLPVLVFVHGDDYGYGAGHPYDPTMLVSQGNIIAVNLNYRLGILGFLNADADGHFKLPFNFALLDQIAALQWVQNIEQFNGDKKRITIMGHGIGATCVNFLMISNAVPTGLLFHRVILGSGSALSPLTADLSKGPGLAKKFARKVKCPAEPSSTMLQCLRELPLRYFLESELWNLFGPSGDGIVVKHSLPPESVIMNRISHYPMIFGVVRAEFLPWLNNHDATYGLESERRRELLRQFIRKHYSFHRNEILAGAIHEYTDWEKPVQHPLNVRDETIDALADAQVVAPMTKVGDLHAASSRTKAYFYIFDYQSKNSEYIQRVGCVHGEDLLYVFGVPLYFYENEFTTTAASHVDDDQQNGFTKPGDNIMAGKTAGEFARKEKWRKRNERSGGLGFFGGNYTWYEVQLSATVIQLWANFIRTGNPNGDLKSQVKVAHGIVPGSKGTSTYQQQQPKGRPQGKSRKVKDETEVKEEELLQLVTGTGVTYSDNRLRLSRDNLMALPTPLEEQHQRQLLQQHHHHYHQPKPIFVEWPEYDSLDKKYLILDLRPKIRNHYRAHKLSFWLHLVPDYQKNNEGTGAVSIHHEISVYSMMPPQNLSKLSVIQPTIFASGLHDTAAGFSKTRYNSSGAIDSGDSSGSKRTGELVSSGSRNSNKGLGASSSNSAPARDFEERQKQQDSAVLHVSSPNNMDPLESTFGFHTYSTALSVTIAIGCSLLILNILIFATFYYEREKRRQEHHRQKQLEQDEFNDEQAPHHRRHQQQQQHHHDQNESNQGQFFRKQSTSSIEERFKIPLTTSSISCGGGGAGSASASLKRRRENSSTGGSAAACAIPPGTNSSVVHPDSTTTVFCEHYVNEESDMNLFNDLYTSPYLVEEQEEDDDDDEQLPPLPLPEPEMEVVAAGPGASSSAAPDHSISDMSYGKYAHGTPTNGSSSYITSSLRSSESIRQKRKAFAIASNSGGGLNEFSMSDVMAEPVTNAPNFSPQSTATTTRSELFEIERIPTAEELIQADGSNAAGDNIMAGKTAGEFARKEKWRKRNERSGGLGFFGGNYTWYEVQLSATVIQLWANFIRTGNPNGDLKSQVKVAHGIVPGSKGTSTYQQQQPKGRPQGKSRKVKDETEVKEEELLQLVTGTGVTYSDNRLRLSRDNLMALPTPLEEQHQRQLLQQHHHHYHQPKPIFVEWPEYDSLDKKYLILDLRPKIRNHYRAHKLSFWLHLVPDYQKNNEGTGAVSIHHEISVYSMMPPQNLSKLSVIQPTIFASGLHDTAAGFSKTRYNSSGAIDSGDSSGSKRTGELVSSGSRNSNKGLGASSSNSAPARDFEERQKQQDSAVLHVSSPNNMDPLESTFGFHTYSTALSVTIAIGCSLLILNILIFATFYYEREKRRQEHHRQKQLEQDEFNDEQAPHHRRHQQQQQHHHDQNESNQGQFFRKQSTSSIEERFKIPLTTSSISCGGGGAGSASASLKRRRENSSTGGSAAACAIPPGTNSSVVHPDSTTTVFCEHYVNEESDMNLFNDLYTSPYLVEEQEEDDDDDEQLPPLPLPEPEMEVVAAGPGASSSAAPDHSISDMSYGKYAHGTPTNGSSSYITSSLRSSESIRQKRKAFAIASNSGGGLNEFSMSDVMAEPVTNAPNFSPQSTATTTRSELFEIERIPTAEELIQADGSNAAKTGGDTTGSHVVNLVPPPVIPDFVGHHHQESTPGAGRFFQNEQETVITGAMLSPHQLTNIRPVVERITALQMMAKVFCQ